MCSMVCVVIILILTVLLIKCHTKTKDDFCVCTQSGLTGRDKVCGKDHNGDLTEYSDFAKLQREAGGPKWTTVSPGDPNYPPRGVNCGDQEVHV